MPPLQCIDEIATNFNILIVRTKDFGQVWNISLLIIEILIADNQIFVDLKLFNLLENK